MVGVLAYGAAASLGVSGGVVQAGGDTELRCDTTGVAVSYNVGFYGSPPAYRIQSVTVSGIDPACLNKGYRIVVALTGADGSLLDSHVLLTTVGSSSSVSGSIGDPPVSQVYGVQVAIWKGGWGGP